MMIRNYIGLMAIALMLAACGGNQEAGESGETGSSGPKGDVRGGTITDAMLPIAMVQSQSPQRGEDAETATETDSEGSSASEDGEGREDREEGDAQ